MTRRPFTISVGARVPEARSAVRGSLNPRSTRIVAAVNSPTVGAFNSTEGARMRPKVSSIAETNAAALSESPPRSKKLSLTPIGDTQNIRSQIAAI